MFSFRPYCRANKIKKNGKAPIVIHIYKSNQGRKDINSGLEIEPKYFNNTTHKFKKGSGDTIKLQTFLDTMLANLRAYVLEHPNAELTEIIEHLHAEDSGNFIKYAEKALKNERKGLAFKTWQQYDYCLRLVADHWSPSLSFSQITPTNLQLFQQRLAREGFAINSQKHALKTIRKYTLRAIAEEKMKKNPFLLFKIGEQQDVEREWNNQDEIDRLKDLWENREKIPQRLHSTLIHYLHSCHCGLRSIDSRRFKTSEHVKGEFIAIVPTKTKKLSTASLRVPINDYTKYLHQFIDEFPLKQSQSRVGRDLNEICELAGISRHISFHCSRHSFAINSLIRGVPLEVVSKWMGHADLKTTQIYARIVDSLSGNEMQKWNNSTDITISLKDLGLAEKFENKEDAIDYIKAALQSNQSTST